MRGRMRRRLFSALGTVAAIGVAAACAQSDSGIAAKVRSKIETDRAISSASHIEVSAQKKVVTLDGTAENSIAKERAVALARGTEDVVDVVDHLGILAAQAQDPPDRAASAAPAANASDDATITATIQSKLQSDQRVAGSRIGVQTNLGIVTLSGTVKSDQVKQDAMQIAQDTAGVQRVENKLTVQNS